MLDQLVESKSRLEESRRNGGFLLTTFFIVALTLAASVTYSLFAKDLATTDGGLELSALVAPVAQAERRPPPPEIKTPPQNRNAPAAVSPTNEILRREAVAAIEDNRTPPSDTTGERDVRAWVKGARLSDAHSDLSGRSPDAASRGSSAGDIGISSPSEETEKDIEPPPPVIKPKTETKIEPAPTPVVKRDKPISGGVVNGRAIDLVKPPYPPAAKAVRAAGAVNVQVLIDEKGNVISAAAVSGHQLLRQAAEQAARASKFSPTMLTDRPVKVTGVIVYNFTAQ